MKAIIQRVKLANIKINNHLYTSINIGLVVYLGIKQDDKLKDIKWIINKIINLRIFADEAGKMNLSALDLEYDIMLVSNFTLYADAKKGNRPSFMNAAPPKEAQSIYDDFVSELNNTYPHKISTGKFQAMMEVEAINDGPINIIIES